MRDARIQISKSKQSFKLWNSSCSFSIFPPVSSENLALFLCICPYHLSRPVTLNLIVNFYHIWQRNGNLFCSFGKTLLNGGEGTKFFFQLKKCSSLNSTVIYSVGLAVAKHYMHTLDSVTGQTIFYLASG